MARAYAPPPRLPLDEWADKYRFLSPEAAALPGRWKTESEPMARGPMRAMTDPLVEKVTVVAAAQVLKTELLLNTCAYYAHGDPAPILMVQPTVEMAEAFSKDRVAPMIRDTPVLAKIFGARSRDSSDTILQKAFPGGRLNIVGANAPAALASRPIRVVLADEIDRYPASAGREGDPVGLAEKRTTTFFNRKIGLVSTPTIKGESRIEASFLEGDRRRYHVPCPHCGLNQVIEWRGVKWANNDPDTARYHCREDAVDKETGQVGCGKPWSEAERAAAVSWGEWIAERPFKGHASFHASQLSSRRVPLSRIVKEWLESKGSVERLKQFINTVLAETWEEGGEKADPDSLYARREPYCAEKMLPAGVGYITSGVDIQRNRWECETLGHGEDEESWSLSYKVHYADPSTPEYWESLDTHLQRTFLHPSGATLRIETTCVDSGDNTTKVYDFCRTRVNRRIFATKGLSNSIGKPIWPKKATRNAAKKTDVFLLGLDNAKTQMQAALMLKQAGPGYCHFPLDDAYDEAYFNGLTVEKAVTKYKFGRPYREWHCPENARNEPWDCRIYAYAALKSAVVDIAGRLRALAAAATARKSSAFPLPAPRVGAKTRRVRSQGAAA